MSEPPFDAAFLRSFVCLRRSPHYETYFNAIRSANNSITTAREFIETEAIVRPQELPKNIWNRLMRARKLPTKTVWGHLGISLPTMPYDEDKIAIQQKSSTEYAVGSHTPTQVKLWSGFDNEIQQAARSPQSTAHVRADFGEQLSAIEDDPEERGITTVIEEEDVTQNAARILIHATDLLNLEFVASNKDLAANADTTVSVAAVPSVAASPNSQRRAQLMARNKERVRFPVETKPWWKFDFFLSEDTQACIINEWEVAKPPFPKAWSPQKRKVFHLLRQVYGQMKEDKLLYSMFHTYRLWWFCRLDNSGTLWISHGFRRNDSSPSVLQAVMTLGLLCSQQHKVSGSIRKHSSSPIEKPLAKKRKRKDDEDDDTEDNTNNERQAPPSDSRENTSKPSSTMAGTTAKLSAANIDLWDCTHLWSTECTKTFSTKCGLGFVKVVIDPSMKYKVQETENEAKIYSYMLSKGINDNAVPAYFGCSNHRGVPLLCLGMEGQDFEDIGLEKLSCSLKKSAIESLKAISQIGVWHGDLALRNIVQSKTNLNHAKITDFGRAQVMNDKDLLEAQVRRLEHMLGMGSSSLPDTVECLSVGPRAGAAIRTA